MERYRYIDVARGIGMLLVVIGHAIGLTMYLTCFFMQLFFVLSGYLYQPGKSYGQNIWKKVERLLVPYFAGSGILLSTFAIVGRTPAETKFSTIGVLYSRCCLYDVNSVPDSKNIFFMDVANGAMWYLTALFSASLIYYLVIDHCLKSNKILWTCVAFLLLVSVALTKLPILLPWSMDIAFMGALLMITGTLLGRTVDIKKWQAGWIITIMIAFLILATLNPGINISVRKYGVHGNWSVLLFALIGISGSIVCIWVGTLLEYTRIGSVLEYIGKRTVTLLIFHILALEFIDKVMRWGIGEQAYGGTWGFLYQMVRIVVAIGGCLLLDRGIMYGKKCIDKLQRGKINL